MTELPQRPRSRLGAAVSASLAAGRLELPSCARCGRVQYPPREVCGHCLGGVLDIASCDPRGTVIACAAVHRSYAEDFADGGPWPVASVKMAAGPVVFAHVPQVYEGDTAVILVALTDRLGDGVLGAVSDMAEFEALQARFRRQS